MPFRKKKTPIYDDAELFGDDVSGQNSAALPKRFTLPFGKKKQAGDDIVLEEGSTTILDVISPTSIDLTGREYIIVDGVYHAYLYITGYGYTTVVGNGWLSALVEAGESSA